MTSTTSSISVTAYDSYDEMGRVTAGQVKARHDYLPFGEETGVGIGGRTTAQGYEQFDGNRKKWARLERDDETGLDYAQARYYSSMQGRFTSPDEFTGGPEELYDFVDDAADNPTFYATLTNPQSLNKYQYAYNNPLRYIDPNGHEADDLLDQEPQGFRCSQACGVLIDEVSLMRGCNSLMTGRRRLATKTFNLISEADPDVKVEFNNNRPDMLTRCYPSLNEVQLLTFIAT